MYTNCSGIQNTVKLGDKERFDKEQIGVKEPSNIIASLRQKKMLLL